MKKLVSVLLACLLLFSGALAQEEEPIVMYRLPMGAEVRYLYDTADWPVPQGYEGLYRIMQTASFGGDVYLGRMKNGKALISVSCTIADREWSAQELLDLWPSIARTIAREGAEVDASNERACVETCFGIEMLHVATTLTADGLTMDVEGYAFWRNGELTEVWSAAPLADETDAELMSDRADLAQFMASLDFNTKTMSAEGLPYQDPDGRFSIAIPLGATVLTVHSSQEEIAKAREAYLAANPAGAETAFNEYVDDIFTQRVTVIFTEDMQGVMEIFASQEENFRDATPEMLSTLGKPIEESLAERFGTALLLSANGTEVLSGYEHAWLGYWLRTEELNLQMDILAAVLPDAWLYEIDIITAGGNQELRAMLYMFAAQTLQYTPLTNALNQ